MEITILVSNFGNNWQLRPNPYLLRKKKSKFFYYLSWYLRTKLNYIDPVICQKIFLIPLSISIFQFWFEVTDIKDLRSCAFWGLLRAGLDLDGVGVPATSETLLSLQTQYLTTLNTFLLNATLFVRNLGTITLVFPQASISNYIEQIIFLCLQARLIGSSISTISWNELEHNTVTSTKAFTFWRIGHEHSCFHINKVLFKVQIFKKETA